MSREAQGTGFGWLVWSLGALFYAFAFFIRVSPSVMVDELMRDFAATAAVLGHLSAFYFYAYAGVQVPVGVILDHWGPRRLLAGAALVTAAGCLLFALAPWLWAAYLGRLLIGLGAGTSFVGALAFAAHWLPARHFGTVAGLSMAFGIAGGLAGQAPLAALVEVIGWRGAMLWAAGFAALLAPPIWLLARDRAGPSQPRADTRLLDGLKLAAANRQVWLLCIAGAGVSGPMLAFGALWGVSYLEHAYGVSRPVAGASASAMLLGWGIGSPLTGWISDRLGRRKAPIVAATALSLLTWLLVLLGPRLPLPLLTFLLFLNGAAGGGTMLVFAAVRGQIPAHAGGAATGILNTAVIGSGALLQPLVGLLLDWQWSGRLTPGGGRLYDAAMFETAFLTLPVAVLIALAAALRLREPRVAGSP